MMILSNWLSWLTLIIHTWTNNNLQWITRNLSQIWSMDNSVTYFSEHTIQLHFQINTRLWVAISTQVFRHKPRHTNQTSQQAFWYNRQLSVKCFVSRLYIMWAELVLGSFHVAGIIQDIQKKARNSNTEQKEMSGSQVWQLLVTISPFSAGRDVLRTKFQENKWGKHSLSEKLYSKSL